MKDYQNSHSSEDFNIWKSSTFTATAKSSHC